ncbi:Hsp20/alpha crystallin family protein [Enhygromyxa salina]|uniref:Spore protein SP21 n=1 Tax=Enhygromyxa salina TaxID=215803 RepID=A0A2S9YR66_9BACT|nr:Hsp20/alpha crystallin family protein [Enhygromyxa salina]PRQ07587.1 Spore protein SP21 [Enhygromyxa salina]
MNLMPWRQQSVPSTVTSLQQEINRMFEDFFSPGQPRFGESSVMPALDIKEDDKYLTVTAELPGVDRKDVQISVHDNVLTLKGEKRSETREEKDNYHFVERKYGSFSRSVMLPGEVDSDHAEATMNNGVLTLRLPTNRGAGAKSISIK